ncbi:MAG TPA: hypothetical protein VF167_01020 [Longimicrobiaceae bacterium]
MSRESEGEDDDLRAQADRRLADALEQTGLPDPRGRYRNWLRELRARDEAAFRKALEYFEQQLVPTVAQPDSDPVREWTEYGLRLAQRLRDGYPVRIDTTGRSRPTGADAPLEDLILHLPTSVRQPPLVVRLPAKLSRAQEATVELLVGK